MQCRRPRVEFVVCPECARLSFPRVQGDEERCVSYRAFRKISDYSVGYNCTPAGQRDILCERPT